MTAETKKQFEKEEQAYWQQRDALLKQYRGKWVAVVGGQVVAAGDHSGEVIREAHRKTGSKVGYVAHVGYEDEVYRIRQAEEYRAMSEPILLELQRREQEIIAYLSKAKSEVAVN
jgi:hypothetical protein